ncbi:Rft protein-domain-containing protein [Lactarius hengduanensis]|nr:Rft protein-domain-containing protein [Lactarius hengduanensis]
MRIYMENLKLTQVSKHCKTYTWAQTRNSEEEGHDCDNDNDIGSHLRHSVVPANASEVVVVFGETSRIFFSKSLSSSPSSLSSENDQEAQETAVELLSTLLLLSTHSLLLLVVFGPPYLLLATALVLPPRYQQTSAPRILRAFRFYLPAMAYNGVLEAFLTSVCTPADLRAQSRMLAAASAALIATALAGARRRTRVRRRRRGTRLGQQHGKHGRAGAVCCVRLVLTVLDLSDDRVAQRARDDLANMDTRPE